MATDFLPYKILDELTLHSVWSRKIIPFYCGTLHRRDNQVSPYKQFQILNDPCYAKLGKHKKFLLNRIVDVTNGKL
jgi:hypothetical protein